jgi:predicted enzyme related to lactoylglutathione lyase
MTSPDRYIAGVPCWVDCRFPQPDAAMAFYGGLFGWEFTDAMPAGSPAAYYIARRDGGDVAAVSGAGDGALPVAAWNTYIRVDSADDTVARSRDAGATVLEAPFDVTDAGRMAVLADPEGAVFCIWEALQHRGASVVNSHGSVNFNDLVSRDPAGAQAFYGAVFGWQTLTMGSASFWTLSAYGDHLEAANPGTRQGMDEMGAPGFIDVVATLASIDPTDTTTPAQWGVTFAVDDVDAIAATAATLGGEVLTAPVDAPWSRMATIRDPQGATFVASQFVPENKDLDAAG